MTPTNASNQREKLLSHLLSGQPVTEDLGRLMFGVRRNAARISELRKAGWDIRTVLDENHCATWTIRDLRNPRKAVQTTLPFEGSADR